jgi:hypothetical protein
VTNKLIETNIFNGRSGGKRQRLDSGPALLEGENVSPSDHENLLDSNFIFFYVADESSPSGLDEILGATMKIFLLDSEFIFSFYVAKESGPGGVG